LNYLIYSNGCLEPNHLFIEHDFDFIRIPLFIPNLNKISISFFYLILFLIFYLYLSSFVHRIKKCHVSVDIDWIRNIYYIFTLLNYKMLTHNVGIFQEGTIESYICVKCSWKFCSFSFFHHSQLNSIYKKRIYSNIHFLFLTSENI
jgi:hypothetical protein